MMLQQLIWISFSDTGFFEVEIVSLKKVVHSKKEGDGYVDSEAKKEAIAKAIEEALK